MHKFFDYYIQCTRYFHESKLQLYHCYFAIFISTVLE